MLEVLPHVNELRDKEDKVSHMSFGFNESASPPQGHRALGRTVGSVTMVKTASSRWIVSGECFSCFATGSSKLARRFVICVERWGRPGTSVFFNGGLWLTGNTSLTPLMLV